MRQKFWPMLAVLVLISLVLPMTGSAATLTATEPPFAISGTVRDVATDGGKTYVVGPFDAQRKVTGSGLILDAGGSGEPNPASFPKVAGRINDVEPDGSGGWYIGGQFAGVGGLPRSNLAHIRADGSVNPDFAPDPDGPVNALSSAGGRLYVGGLFSKVAGASRSGLAAVTAGGSLVDAFDPQLSSGARVIVATPSTVYASGSFDETGAAGDTSVIAVSATTGTATSFKVNLSRPGESTGLVKSLAVAGGDLLIGGSFLTVNGQSRSLLARVNGTTGALSNWNAQVEGMYGSGTDSVAALTTVGDRLYLGGQFKKVGGQSRLFVGAVNLATGNLDAWQPSGYTFGSNYEGVKQIAVSGDRVFLAGNFFVGPIVWPSKARAVVAVSAGSGAVAAFDPGVPVDTNPPGSVSALATQNGKLYVGGMFAGAGTPVANRNGALRLNSDGSLDPSWTPPASSPSDGWSSVAVGPNSVYLSSGSKVIAVDKNTGAAKPGFSAPAGLAGPLTLAADKLYVTKTNTLAELDSATGTQSSWSPTFTGSGNLIHDVVGDGSNLYLGGMFTAIDGATRKGFARFALPSHTLAPASAIEGWVTSLIPFGRRLLARGQLQPNGDFLNQRGGALHDMDTQGVAWWPADPAAAQPPGNSDVIFDDAPEIASWGGLVHRAAARDIATGKLVADTPLGTGGFGSINATDQSSDWLAGNFLSVGTTVTGPLAKVALSSVAIPSNTVPPAISGSAQVGSVLTCAPGAWSGNPSFTYAWLRDGSQISGASAATYTVSSADAGHSIGCRVTGTNASGSSSATSISVSIPAADQPRPPAANPPGDAPVDAPNPPEGPRSEQGGQSRPGQGERVPGGSGPVLAVAKTIKLAKLRRGVAARISGLKPGSAVTAELRLGKTVVGRKTSRAGSAGIAIVRLRPAARQLRRIRNGTRLSIRVRSTAASGRTTSANATFVVR